MMRFDGISRLPRWVHRLKASMLGYFWLPCPLCGRMFGGHEWLPGAPGLPSSIPSRRTGIVDGICPRCTRKGLGVDPFAADPFAVVDDPIARIQSAKITGVEQFARWLMRCRQAWPEGAPSPPLEYVAGCMAQQYANWLDGRDADSLRSGWPHAKEDANA